MANYMRQVANMLSVEMNEDFKCEGSSCTYRVTENGLMCNGCYGADSLMMILNGERIIKRAPWKPEDEDRFYSVAIDGQVIYKYWDDCSSHKNYYKLGNCYRTGAEAEANREKWISFYTSDEVLEV